MPFENHHVAFASAVARELASGVSRQQEETTVCVLACASLRHAYRGAAVAVTPATGRPEGELGLGVLDVRLAWPYAAEAPLLVRVVVHDELLRGQWHEASTAIGDAVRAARCPAPPHPERKTDP